MDPFSSHPEDRLIEVSRVAFLGGRISELGGPAWRASDGECRRWFRNGARFFMYSDQGTILDVYLDERGFLTMAPTWRTSGDRAFLMHLHRLPRMAEEGGTGVTVIQAA